MPLPPPSFPKPEVCVPKEEPEGMALHPSSPLQDEVRPSSPFVATHRTSPHVLGYPTHNTGEDHREGTAGGSDGDASQSAGGKPPIDSHTVAFIHRGGGRDATDVSSGVSSQQWPIRYDPEDHTVATKAALATPSSGPSHAAFPRLWVLPRLLLAQPLRTSEGLLPSRSGGGAGGAGGASDLSTRVSTPRTTTEAAVGTGSTPGGSGISSSSAGIMACADNSKAAVDAERLLSRGTLLASVLRLPHPRHGLPFLCLLRDPGPTPTFACTAAPLVWEVQAQAPPSGFAQSWFVGDDVIPSHPPAPPTNPDKGGRGGEVLVATPLDVTFFALNELLGDAQRYARRSRSFMTPADLFWDGWDSVSPAEQRVATATADAAIPRPSGGREGYEVHASIFEGVGKEEDSQSSASSSSWMPHVFAPPPTTSGLSGMDRRPNGGCKDSKVIPRGLPTTSSQHPGHAVDWAWSGWASAANTNPLLLQSCFAVLRSPEVLCRLCEVRDVAVSSSAAGPASSAAVVGIVEPGQKQQRYYRPSETVAIEWLRRKVCALQTSPVLKAMLQGGPTSTSTPAAAAAAVTVAPGATKAERAEGEVVVPVSVAFGVVAEYVPERLHALLAAACGIPNLNASESSAPATTAIMRGEEKRVGDSNDTVQGQSAGTGKAATATAAARPKSASVQRLLKAGRPPGTPTLLSMFAKKRAKTENDA